MTEPVTVGIQNNKFVIDGTTVKAMTLYRATTGNGAATLHDETDNNYQVPVGKKFIILKIMLQQAGAEDRGEFWNSALIDSQTGFRFAYMNTIASGQLLFDVYYEIGAGRYITYWKNAGGNCTTLVTGVEVDV
jgi:hypothetical protein